MWLGEVRYALKAIGGRRTLALAMTLSIGFAVGLNTVILGMVYGVFLRPLPYERPWELVLLSDRTERAPQRRGGVTAARISTWRQLHHVFRDAAAFEWWESSPSARFDYLSPELGAVSMRGAFVTPNFFDVLGVAPALGQTFSQNTTHGVATDVEILISRKLWAQLFGDSQSIVGERIPFAFDLGGKRATRTCTVVGVLPIDFDFSYPESTDVWAALPWEQISQEAQFRNAPVSYRAIARLRPGVSIDQARAAVAVAEAEQHIRPSHSQARPSSLESLHEFTVGHARPAATLAGAAAICLLLIGCANVGSLSIARTQEQRRELAIRAALGATRYRLRRQILTESAVIAVIGLLFALSIWVVAHSYFAGALPKYLPRAGEASMSLAGAICAASLTLITILTSVLASARSLSTLDVQRLLSDSSLTASASSGALKRRRSLLIAQVALVSVLLFVTSLLLRDFVRLGRVDPGFDGRGVIVAVFRAERARSLTGHAYLADLSTRLVERVRTIPGVADAAVTANVPFLGGGGTWRVSRPESINQTFATEFNSVSADYFSVLRMKMIAGRAFSRHDSGHSLPVAIISESLARTAFDGEDPIGKRLRAHAPVEIVGVVRDVRSRGLDSAPRSVIYVPFDQYPVLTVAVMARPASSSQVLIRDVRTALRDVEREEPIQLVTTLDALRADSLAERRLILILTSGFTFVGLGLAISGLFGMVSRTVAERLPELGIRAALGATPPQLAMRVLRYGVAPALAGVALGLIGATWSVTTLQSLLHSRTPVEAVTISYWITVTVILSAAIAASLGPAIRVFRLPAFTALRR
jgi:putative ABC transport system permease protein